MSKFMRKLIQNQIKLLEERVQEMKFERCIKMHEKRKEEMD